MMGIAVLEGGQRLGFRVHIDRGMPTEIPWGRLGTSVEIVANERWFSLVVHNDPHGSCTRFTPGFPHCQTRVSDARQRAMNRGSKPRYVLSTRDQHEPCARLIVDVAGTLLWNEVRGAIS